MIKSFLFENFKSFEKAELNLEDITSLIGTNSSGKSNAIEGISILAEIATGRDFSVILDGTRNSRSLVRGGSKACCRFRTQAFRLGCLVDLDEEYDLLYMIKIHTNGRILVEEESLYKVKNGIITNNGDKIFKTKPFQKGESSDIKVEYRNGKKGTNPDILCIRTSGVLSQIATKMPGESDTEKENLRYIDTVVKSLKGIFILNPIPAEMRDYARETDTELKTNCENISPVLYHLCKDTAKRHQLLDIICSLPENEVTEIGFVETKLGDVIFGLKERYLSSAELVDAKKLSDGTLRCIAIVAAVLNAEPGDTIVVEEIDNGIHPGRVQNLIDKLQELAHSRKIDIILTTHNAQLMNRYDKGKLLGVSVVYREKDKGTSRIVPLVDVKQFAKALLGEGLGEAMADDTLLALIKNTNEKQDYSWLGV